MKTVLDDPEYRDMDEHFINLGRPVSFDGFLSYTVESPDFDHARLAFEGRDDLVGSVVYKTLHGGIIASFLEVAGGHATMLSVMKQLKGQPIEKQIERVSRIAAIDLRIDYLRPGKGNSFIVTGRILRTSNKVSVVHMELCNDEDTVIAVGTGTYTVG